MDALRLLTTAETARRLGVKRETVYAYVSRGLLARHPASTVHDSRFDPDVVERLAARARQTDRSGALEVVVETRLSLLDPDGRLSFRGHDAIELARVSQFRERGRAAVGGGDRRTMAADDGRARARRRDPRRDGAGRRAVRSHPRRDRGARAGRSRARGPAARGRAPRGWADPRRDARGDRRRGAALGSGGGRAAVDGGRAAGPPGATRRAGCARQRARAARRPRAGGVDAGGAGGCLHVG